MIKIDRIIVYLLINFWDLSLSVRLAVGLHNENNSYTFIVILFAHWAAPQRQMQQYYCERF